LALCSLALLSLALEACAPSSLDYLTVNLKERKAEQKQLITLLTRRNNESETRFALMNRLATNLLAEGNKASLIVFLTQAVEEHPDDPYNAYWLLMVAHAYLEDGSSQIARYYFERIVHNCQDMEIHNESIHLLALKNLINIHSSPEQEVGYYTNLITRFPDKIDLGYAYFMLARSYERLGEWELAIQTYSQFLGYGQFNVIIPGIPDSYEYAKRIVDYDSSSKDWTFETLDELVASIKGAINTYNVRALDHYRAKVNFFAMSWKQESSDNNAQADFHMRDFMGGNRIRYNESLDASSNPNEAYLRTQGWNQYVSVWYLYFRKINFPADPDIHGRWEWAGIYYGEKM